MSPEKYIDLLLQKYQQAPSFPFLDWTTNPVSFYALMNLWDELFKTAAGSEAEAYEAAVDVQMDIDSNIYDIRTKDRTRRFSVHPEPDGGTFFVIGKSGDAGYLSAHPDSGLWPDRTELGFATDIDRLRLIACFKIIRHYVAVKIGTPSDAELLYKEYAANFRHVFGFPDYDPFASLNPDQADD